MTDQSFKRDYTPDVDTAGAIATGAQEVQDKASHALDGAANRVQGAGHTVSARVATAADKAAAALGSTAEYVREFDSRDVMKDVTDMAKRHPGAMLATAVFVGFLVGRSATRT